MHFFFIIQNRDCAKCRQIIMYVQQIIHNVQMPFLSLGLSFNPRNRTTKQSNYPKLPLATETCRVWQLGQLHSNQTEWHETLDWERDSHGRSGLSWSSWSSRQQAKSLSASLPAALRERLFESVHRHTKPERWFLDLRFFKWQQP